MGGSIKVASQTTRLNPSQKHHFQVQFNEIEPCRLRFELTDYDSGTITSEGEYTAPEREGSFEVRILCENNTDISTYAYIDVRKP